MLSKRTLASIRAGRAALEKQTIHFRAPRATLNYLETLWQNGAALAAPVVAPEAPEDAAMMWLEALAQQRGADPAAFVSQGNGTKKVVWRLLDTIPATTLNELNPSRWQVGLSADFEYSLARLGPALATQVAEALTTIFLEPGSQGAGFNLLAVENMSLWQYAHHGVRVIYEPDLVRQRLTLLVLELSREKL